MKATAVAHPNIALVKYWGKRHVDLNLPSAGSLSVTLAGMKTRTTVTFDPQLDKDIIFINDRVQTGRRLERLSAFIDRMRSMAGVGWRVKVNSENDFPTAAGLASSSSGFAALAAAGCAALNLEPTREQLSVLARLGSGSAARSVPGGFVEMLPGDEDADGTDAFAEPFAGYAHWDLRCIIALTARGEKSVGSTEAMLHTADTSPYFEAFVDSVPEDIKRAREAVKARDFLALGQVAEHSCLKFHASAIAAKPGILYWNGQTIGLIHRVRRMREEGVKVFFTIDAGPHVKVFCESAALSAVREFLKAVPGVHDFIVAKPGPGVRLEVENGRLIPAWRS